MMARADKSARITSAVEAIKRGEFNDYSKAAAHFGCDRTSVSKRFRKITTSRKEADSLFKQCLTDTQERVLIDRINYLSDRQMPPTSRIVRNLAEEIRGVSVGKNWTGQFIKRHQNVLKSMYLRNIDNLRVVAEYAPAFELFYDTLERAIEKHQITAENLYNFDEKGWLIGMGRMLKRVMTHEAFDRMGGMKNSQDGSREFISMLACISAIGKAIPSLLIYKGSNNDLQTSWLEDVTEEAFTYFTSSENGWSNKKIGLTWLKEVFERHTKPVNSRAKRLLIVDGHSSHVNMEFIDFADSHRIIILLLPPHSTHKLQPLDVGLFQPLSTAYSVELDAMMARGQGFTHMSKRFFFKLFKLAFDQTFTEERIQNAFAKPGIWPVYRDEIIRAITRQTKRRISSQHVSKLPRTPRIAPELRQFQIAFIKDSSTPMVTKLFKALTIATTSSSILSHDNQGLREAIQLEQQKRKRGKRLDLSGEPDSGTILFSPEKVVRCRVFQAEKDSILVQKEKEKDERKVQAAANKLLKAQKAELVALKKVEALKHKEQKKQDVLSRKASPAKPKSVASTPKKVPSRVPKLCPPSVRLANKLSPRKTRTKSVIIELEVDVAPIQVNSRGRTIVPPQRFKKA